LKKLLSKWHLIVIIGFLLFAGLIFFLTGENSVISVHDNLDLFTPQYQIMKDSGTFFSFSDSVPFLADLSRAYLPSELNLYSIIFFLLPSYYAYVVCYLLKIIIAIWGAALLAKVTLKDTYPKYKQLVLLIGFAYGILNLFPNFGIAFASLPLFVFIMNRIINKPKLYWYLALLAYPLLSYFSYIGIFIIGYMVIYFIYRWIAKKKFPWQVLIAIPVLCIGFVLCEYRLFYTMLFSDVTSIRESMVLPSLSFGEILASIWEGFALGDMHTESMQVYFILPVCLGWFGYESFLRIKNHEAKKIFKDGYNGILLFILINSIIYGLYNCENVRNLFELIIPPLKGFEFGRTEFLNPFLWYVAFFIVLIRIYDRFPKVKWLSGVMAMISIFIIVLSGTRYNDLFHTCYDKLYQATHDGKHGSELTYQEFYSTELFDEIKEDIGYCGQWSVAYGLYPAILQYNGIRTLDGYLGYYSEYYKKEFRKIIAPALERVPESQAYFDNWGARCYLYSGTNPTIISGNRNYEYESEDIYIDLDAFKDWGGRYIFSRLLINNAEEAGLTLVKTYEDESSPYTIYLYQTASRYCEVEHSDVIFQDRQVDYNIDRVDEIVDSLNTLVKNINEYKSSHEDLSDEEICLANPSECAEVISLFNESQDIFNLIQTKYALNQYDFNSDSSDEQALELRSSIYDDYMNSYDKLLQAFRELAQSPFEHSLKEIINPLIVDSFAEYEDMTEEEMDRSTRIQSLQSEYTQAASEEYYFTYEGKEWSMEELNNELYSGSTSLTQDQVVEIYQGLMAQKASVLAEIYIEIRNLNNEIALEEGYDNYAEYAYSSVFPRDYSVDDAKTLFNDLRKYCVSYYQRTSNEFSKLNEFDPGYITSDDTDTFELLYPYICKIDPELGESMKYLLDYHLYNLKYSETKAPVGFTMPLSTYGDAYIFDSPYGTSYDFNTFIHEFGHFNNMFRVSDNMFESVNNLDVSEIHSQALCMLMLPYIHEMFQEPIGSFFEYNFTSKLMDSVISSCAVAEFEIWAYENMDATTEELSQKYFEIQTSYGNSYAPGITDLYEWIDISHLFNTPLYYISYATSALTSLQIYNLSKEDYHAATEKYMELTTYKSYWLFKDVTHYVGFDDVFKDGVAKDIFKSTYLNLRKNYNSSIGK